MLERERIDASVAEGRTPSFTVRMALMAIVRKLKVVRQLKVTQIRRLASRAVQGKKNPSWKGISHGHHVVDTGSDGSVVVQRGQVGLSEVWLFGSFGQQMGDEVLKVLQSQIFENKLQTHPSEEKLSEKQIVKRAKEMMKAAYDATTEQKEPHETEEGSVVALLVNCKKIVAAGFGGYKAVLCQGGIAVQIGNMLQKTERITRSLNSISEKLFGQGAVDEDENKRSSLAIVAQWVGSKTEFIILGSNGIWEVLGSQEAVHLVRHMEDAQEAARCLANEAVARMTKSSVICIIIRLK